MNKKIGVKISMILGVVLVVCMAMFVFLLNNSLHDKMRDNVKHQVGENLDKVIQISDVFYKDIMKNTNTLFNVLEADFGSFNINPTQTIDVKGHQSPAFYANGELINGNFDMVDKFTKATGASATIFVRIKDDFLRISTSLRKTDNSRAFGTYLGKKSPAYKAIMNKQTYKGPAKLFGRRYMTVYKPILDKDQNVIGILYMGNNFTKELESIKDGFKNLKLGKSGYFWAINQKEKLIEIHPKSEGKPVSVHKIPQYVSDTKNGYLEYSHNNEDKIAIFKYYKPLDWIVVGSATQNDFMEVENSTKQNLIIGAIILTLILIILNTVLINKLVASPIKKLANELASSEGDLTKKISIKGENEIAEAGIIINNFIEKVRGIVVNIKNSSDDNLQLASSLSNMANETQTKIDNTLNITSQTSENSAHIYSEMQNSIQEAKNNKKELDTSSSHILEASKSIVELNENIQESAKTELELAQKVQQLSSDANQVKEVLVVISDIADQTNLLALNAAIEAARAGEHGRGFAVVADEVRKLAERTQKSLTEINATINIIVQSIVETSETMNINAKKIEELSSVSSEVDKKITTMSHTMQNTIQATEHSLNSYVDMGKKIENIMDSMKDIEKLSDENANNATQIGDATIKLDKISKDLGKNVTQFKV